MKAIGIQKASRRLAQAEGSLAKLAELENGLNVHAFEDEWFDFLVHLHSVPEILRTSAKSSPKARQWIDGRFKLEIRKDPLLRFLFQARGTDFHGIDCGTQPHTEGAKYLGYEPNPPIQFTLQAADGSTQTLGGGAIMLEGDVKSFTFSFRLCPVTDKYGNTFDPPEEHNGQKLMSATPVSVAEIALEYYRTLLRGASELVGR